MRNNIFYRVVVTIIIIILVSVVLINVQLYRLMGHFDITGLIADLRTDQDDQSTYTALAIEDTLKPVTQQLENRIKIDDFLDSSLWNGTATTSDKRGSLSLSNDDSLAEVYRKYDGFLKLQSYIYLDIAIEDIENAEWITLYLLEDLSYANYYEYNLLSALKDKSSPLIINKKDFIVGSGKPQWDKISTVKIAFETDEGTKSTITLGEISTYSSYPMCSIWFDDGWVSTYTQAFPVMKEKNFKGILSVISSHVNFMAYCNNTQLDTMYEYGWDFVNHTDTHKDLSELTAEEAEREISVCRDFLRANGYIRACDNMAPPYCATNQETDAIISNYAHTSRVKWNSYNQLPIENSYNIGFKEVTNDTSPEEVQEWIDYAIENDLWLVLMFHSIESPADVPTKYTMQDFKEIIDYLDKNKSKIEVATLAQVLNSDIVQPFDAAPVSIQTMQPQLENTWTLAWEDHFNGTSLDTSIWNAVNGAHIRNNELQTYREKNIVIKDGYLNILSDQADKEYYSGAITTENKKLFLNGKIEIRAKLPGENGIFPAFWMLPQSGDLLPEIDIIEFLGNTPSEIWHVLHYKDREGKQQRDYKQLKGEVFNQDFHLYTLEWTQDSLIWYIDDVESYRVDNNIPNTKMYLYLNTAIGGNWVGSPDSSTKLPQTMLIDYVKYYEKS